ncbi:MAG: CpaF family protein, partial [Syntrophomonadaceae bacterium]|nr:CpaF family protein [Syntrophomonadaceae bacterium]
NNPEQVFVLKNLSNEKVDISFRDEQEVKKIIDRIIMHDRGVSLNKSSPRIEVMRKDGTRLTATYPPVSENLTFVLRKQLSQVLTMEQFIKTNTLDEKIWELLEALVKGRANILISGGGGSGKTTLVRSLFGLTNPMARTLVIESDRELFLKKHFPNRDVVELEEHPEAGSPLGDLFRTVLRYSPNLIIVGEFRGAGEAREAIRACERGHYGSMATAHFDSPQEAIEGTGRLLLEEGFNASPQIATLMVAGAYNIVVQMFGDSTRGIIKVESITEVNVHHDQVKFNDLIKWIPDVRDYSVGYWDIVGLPSTQLLSRLRRYGMDLPKYFAQKNP